MHAAASPAWICMEAGRCKVMAKEGVALGNVKENLRRETDHRRSWRGIKCGRGLWQLEGGKVAAPRPAPSFLHGSACSGDRECWAVGLPGYSYLPAVLLLNVPEILNPSCSKNWISVEAFSHQIIFNCRDLVWCKMHNSRCCRLRRHSSSLVLGIRGSITLLQKLCGVWKAAFVRSAYPVLLLWAFGNLSRDWAFLI